MFSFFFFYVIFSFSLTAKANSAKCKKRLNIHCYSHYVKKQLYNKNGVRVYTLSD